jgi:biofilm PGA synthesis N-glycosyltransferase PgaC
MVILFWIAIFIIFYTYAGYGILLFLLTRLKKFYAPVKKETAFFFPSLTVIVPAYNEENVIEEKIKNTLSLQYPRDRIHYLFITDGSSDSTAAKILGWPSIQLMNSPERKGKINAIHRAMKEVNSEIVVFTDANTTLNRMALRRIINHYTDPAVGAVSGEKRVRVTESSDATAGEGFYWKYESKLKKWDSELHSVVGAAGELFSIRTALYEPIEEDTILDDFMISMRIAQKGYRIVYEPGAYAIENASASTKEELKRKIRIAAGGIQSILRLKPLLNPFHRSILSFQYISHRVLRWTVAPFLMISALVLNFFMIQQYDNTIYRLLFVMQIAFYLFALLGWFFEKKEIKVKIFFIPYYFCLMNYAVLAGMIRYFSGKQSAAWEKAQRKAHPQSPAPQPPKGGF